MPYELQLRPTCDCTNFRRIKTLRGPDCLGFNSLQEVAAARNCLGNRYVIVDASTGLIPASEAWCPTRWIAEGGEWQQSHPDNKSLTIERLAHEWCNYEASRGSFMPSAEATVRWMCRKVATQAAFIEEIAYIADDTFRKKIRDFLISLQVTNRVAGRSL